MLRSSTCVTLRKKFLKVGVAAGAGGLGLGVTVYGISRIKHDQNKEARQAFLSTQGLNARPSESLPTRAEQLNSLANDQFDVLVIGGGATGAGQYCHKYYVNT